MNDDEHKKQSSERSEILHIGSFYQYAIPT